MAKKTTHANRGRDLEEIIIEQCKMYFDNGIANIHKIATDWTVIRRFNPIKKRSEIVTAFPKEKAIIDFMGDYDGRAIAIETKQTNNKTRFDFNDIKEHQYEFFKKWKGLKYYIIWFKELDRKFLIHADIVQNEVSNSERKSMTLKWIEDNSVELNDFDFLKNII